MTLTREEVRKIFSEVKANRKHLDECVGPHDFSLEHSKIKTVVRSYKCTKCDGWVDSLHKYWYEEGLNHARTQVN